MKNFHLHLISDSTGETVSSVSRSALAQFEDIEVEEHNWSLVRTKGQIDKLLEEVSSDKGFVLYTISDSNLRKYLRKGCQKINVPCVSVLSRIISDLSSYLGVKANPVGPGKQHELDEEYFSRVEAINFSLNHDDGQSVWDLEESDIIIIGASRTSKSPTSMYLAYRGYRTANIPYVPNVEMPEVLDSLKDPLIVCLTINPEVLVQIRKNRLLSLNEKSSTDYTDIEEVKAELLKARKYYTKNKWPVIDVSRSSVEETAAKIIQQYQKHKSKLDKQRGKDE